MNFEDFRRQIKTDLFDYQQFADCFKGLKKIRDKISSLVLEGKLIRLKKGLYVFGEEWRRAPLSLEVIANVLYGPSCISLEYALNRYGLLAERASSITSLAIGKTKTFDTPLGVFEYKAIGREKFKVGIEYRDLGEEGGYFIASKEKALVDFVYKTPGIRTKAQLRFFLFEEMRIDVDLFNAMDKKKLAKLAAIYKKKSLTLLSQL
ncbi:MAG: hypothetical protein SP1CHLAM54_00510 [Chlamydiia bacterium]|nr:hypothetical protein [Chlamydiia bacterium]MCH9614973.1 hypothetical protein [Chlamydiia bacterium]MCH9629977.1 hypothetical protein [Chlamydiia bacterium]